MPHIDIIDYQPDDDGGWLVRWRDTDNVDGQTVEAFIHLTAEHVASLEREHRHWDEPSSMGVSAVQLEADRETARGSDVSQREALGIPDGTVPYAIRDWLDGYQQYVGGCIARHKAKTSDVPTDAALDGFVKRVEMEGG